MTTVAATTNTPHGRIRIETGAKRVRAYLGGELVADTTRPVLVWEVPYYPAYYFPLADVRAELLAAGRRAVALAEPWRRPHASPSGRAASAAPGAALRYEDSPIEELRDLDPPRLGRDGRLVRGGRGGLHPPARPVHAGRHPRQLASRAGRGRRRHRRRVDEPAAAVRDRPAGPLLPAQDRTSGWTCSPRPTPSATARTRARPSTGRCARATPSTRTSRGRTGRRCPRARRSPAWSPSTTRRSTSTSTANCRSGRPPSSLDHTSSSAYQRPHLAQPNTEPSNPQPQAPTGVPAATLPCWIDPHSKKDRPRPGPRHDGTLGSRHRPGAQPDHHSVAGCYITPPRPARAHVA